MLKIYGSGMCPECAAFKYNLERNNIEYEFNDITGNLNSLKEFMRLRDKDETFNYAKENGYIGIPAIIADDGSLSIDWENYLFERGIETVNPGEEGAACAVDGKSC